MSSEPRTQRSEFFSVIVRRPLSALLLAGMLATGAYIVVVRANGPSRPTPDPRPTTAGALGQRSGLSLGTLHTKLSLQPEAEKLRRKLGQRFLAAGKERAVLVGTLIIGGQQSPITIIRTQNDDGESVEVAGEGGLGSLTWNASDGVRSAGKAPAANQRSLVERLALDSPDQFVLAQTRGASYYTVARGVRPSSAGPSDDYTGPIWDVVQITEPVNSVAIPLSSWRLYQINVSTGLIDRVVCQEQSGQDLTAELTDWVNQQGERVPSHITWKQGVQTVMELRLNGAAFAAR